MIKTLRLWTGAASLLLSSLIAFPSHAQSLTVTEPGTAPLYAQQIDLDEIQRQIQQNPQLIQQAQQLLKDNPELVQQTIQQLLQENPNLLQEIQQRPELMQQVEGQLDADSQSDINDFIRQNPDLYEQLKDSLPPQ